MRVLIDECLDPGIQEFLAGQQTTTVGEANWGGDGILSARASGAAPRQTQLAPRLIW